MFQKSVGCHVIFVLLVRRSASSACSISAQGLVQWKQRGSNHSTRAATRGFVCSCPPATIDCLLACLLDFRKKPKTTPLRSGIPLLATRKKHTHHPPCHRQSSVARIAAPSMAPLVAPLAPHKHQHPALHSLTTAMRPPTNNYAQKPTTQTCKM